MSALADCRVTTWIRNSSRASIKASSSGVDGQTEAEARDRASGSITEHPPEGQKMPICTVMEKRNGVLLGAELSCSVREENKAQRESYSADWQSVSLKTQPQDRQTMSMKDQSRRETLTRQWQARPLVQSCPSGVFRVGTVERGVREHQLLPKRNTLPLPIFVPAELGVRLGRGAPHTEEDLQPFPTPDGVCPSKRTVDEITRDLPPVKPVLMEFAKAPKALGRSMSQEAQRG